MAKLSINPGVDLEWGSNRFLEERTLEGQRIVTADTLVLAPDGTELYRLAPRRSYMAWSGHKLRLPYSLVRLLIAMKGH